MAEGTTMEAPHTAAGASVGPRGDERRPPTARTVRRRQPLPSGRAVVGGFLVALSALGIYLAWSGATQGSATSYVVAARDLQVGARLTSADLELVTMELPEDLATNSAFDSVEALDGVKVINPVRRGELVQASSLVAAEGAPGQLEVSFAIEAARAVDGTLKAGEFVDVLATFGAGSDTYTTTILQGARILDVADSAGSLGSTDSLTITVAVADADDARAIAHAVNVAKLVLVRTDDATTTAGQGGTYRAPATGDDGSSTAAGSGG